MNAKAKEVHAANRERVLRERAAFAARSIAAPVKPAVKRPFAGAQVTRLSSGVAEVETPQTRERACIRCEKPFRSEGAHHRMCWSCARLPEGFGL